MLVKRLEIKFLKPLYQIRTVQKNNYRFFKVVKKMKILLCLFLLLPLNS